LKSRVRHERTGAAAQNRRGRRLPEIEALIERAQAVHSWLQAASACECDTFEACSLFDARALGDEA
jgi:hypothetical protein